MCREHQLLQHLATTHRNTHVCFPSTNAFNLHPLSHRALLCSPRRLHFGLVTGVGEGVVSVELREAEELGYEVGAPSGLQGGEKCKCSLLCPITSGGLRGDT